MAAPVAHAALVQALEQALIKPIIQLLVRPAQGRSADRLTTEVVTMMPLTSQRRFNVSQASAATQLANRQRYKLRPARQGITAALAINPICLLLEFMSRQQF